MLIEKPQMNKKSIYIFVFMLIYFSSSTVLCGTSSFSVILTSIVPDIVFFVFCIHFLNKNGFRIPIINVCLYAVIVCSLLLMMIYNRDFSLNNLYEIVQLTIAFIVASVLDSSTFEKAFTKSILLICSFSLCVFVLRIAFPGLIRLFPIINNTSNVSFNFCGLTVVPTNYLASRNFAIFREPGVFVCFICIAYILGKKNNILTNANIAVLFLSLLSTLSTTGYIALFVIILSIILEKKSFLHFLFAAIAGVLFLVILKTQTNLLEPTGPLFSKFMVRSSSYNARMGSFKQNFQLIKQYPVIGAGWENSKRFFLGSSLNAHNTNTILYYFSCYGLIVGMVYTFGLLSAFNVKRSVHLSVLLLGVLLLVLSGERICFDISLLTLVFYGFMDLSVFKKNKAFTVSNLQLCWEEGNKLELKS